MTCDECGSALQPGRTCDDDFHRLLAWEHEQPALGVVHHLMVLCFHLQHPSRYSPDGLRVSIDLLDEFVANGTSTEDIPRRMAAALDSGNRDWHITARPGAVASYGRAVAWPLVAADVVAAGAARYIETVRVWADAVHAAVHATPGAIA